jgi:hypothetical protein
MSAQVTSLSSVSIRFSVALFRRKNTNKARGRLLFSAITSGNRRFGGDKNIIKHRNLTLDGASYTVVGVMPAGIYPMWPTTSGHLSFDEQQQQFWTPMSFTAQWAAVRTAHVLGVLARMKPGVSLEQATSEMNTIAARLEQEHTANRGEGIVVNQFMNEVVGDVRPALFTLLAAVGLVLLIACANVPDCCWPNTRSESKEIAIRAALGAGRTRLVRQFFYRRMLLFVLSARSQVLRIAAIGTNAVAAICYRRRARDWPRSPLDWRVLGFTIVIAFVTCLIFGLIPAVACFEIRPAQHPRTNRPLHSQPERIACASARCSWCFQSAAAGDARDWRWAFDQEFLDATTSRSGISRRRCVVGELDLLSRSTRACSDKQLQQAIARSHFDAAGSEDCHDRLRSSVAVELARLVRDRRTSAVE